MTERTAEEWGRLAVSLPGWRWTMSMSDISGLIALEWIDEKRTKLRCWDTHDPSCHGEYRAYYLTPDPDDPATAGCLLALLSVVPTEGYMAHVIPPSSTVTQWRIHMNTARTGPTSAYGTTLGRACIAAAEALGRWPGGEG